MAGINEMIRRIKSIDHNAIIEEAIARNPEALVNLQRQQMLKGERRTGKKIGKYKNTLYAKKKFEQNSLAGFGFKDEKLTGDFQKAIFADTRKGHVVLTSADSKLQSIVDRDGWDIFGLNKISIKEYSPILRNDSVKIIKALMNGSRL